VKDQAADRPARPRRRVVLLFAVLLAAVLAALVEGGARLWSAWRERRDATSAASLSPPLTPEQADAAGRALGLDAYEMADPVRRGRWRLRPGYRASFAEMLAQKRAAGRSLTVRHMEEAGPRLGIAPGDTAVEVNAEGFRGPALDASGGRVRILVLGDSCTFGSPLSERYPYARALERALAARGHAVEVVNGGVEGYSPDDVLARVDELRALRPRLVTLYLGWNALYRDGYLEDARGVRRYLHSARMLSRGLAALRARLRDRREAALQEYERSRRPDRTAGDVRLVDAYVPSFVADVAQIAEAMQAAGSRVVVLTLPGLYATDREPSPRALELGHLPTFTDNPFVLARMAERTNEALRALARERGLALVDLERWGREALAPPEEHFIDSVHLDEESQARLGEHLADALAPLLEDGSPAAERAQASSGSVPPSFTR
jgi:lysophospholipase L1-like esterase